MSKKRSSNFCPYCGNGAKFSETSSHLYSRDYGPVWECAPCRAWVGCHPGGKPLGRLANAELRRHKMAAHDVFDPLWKRRMERDGLRKGHARAKGYKWLAEQLGINRKDCHIGMFDVETCLRVIAICRPFSKKVSNHTTAQSAFAISRDCADALRNNHS